MPFTLSHPAAVALLWPVARPARLPLAALAIGAMSPDFEFFLHLRPVARWSHTVAGIFFFCLPVGVTAYALWEFLVRALMRDLCGMAPAPRHRPTTWTWWVRGAAGVVLGAATHLLWDGVTHAGYWGTQLWPGLRTTALTAGTHAVPWYSLLQHLSTVVGGLVVLRWCHVTIRAHGNLHVLLQSGWRRRSFAAILITAAAAGVLNGARGPSGIDLFSLERLIGKVAVGALAGGAIALLALALQHRSTREAIEA